jgi:two-component system chemotaxis sensor kinase CheA
MNEVIREFLLETQENLAQLDLDLVTLEQDPKERETLARVFRTLHTVKGTAGFLGLMKLQAITHSAEHLLTRLTNGELLFNVEIAGALLATVDTIRKMLVEVEKTETEGTGDYTALVETLEQLRTGEVSRTAATPPLPMPSLMQSAPPQAERSAAPAPAPKLKRPVFQAVEPVAPTSRLDKTEPPAQQTPSLKPANSSFKPRNGAEHTRIWNNSQGLLPPEPEPEITAAEPVKQLRSAVSESSLRVDVGVLDKLMTLVGELVLARNQIMQFSTSFEDPAFLDTVQRLNGLTTELQAGVMKTRMQPIGNIWSKFPRLVRDLAVACGKQLRFEMEGRETDLDKTIIEAIRDPLTHMVRNAIDHGIETPSDRRQRGKPTEGRLSLHAFHEGGKVVIEVSDDGGGIDPRRIHDKAIQAKLITTEQADQMSERELLDLVFMPGFSTADKVTHFSGRGVGMNVVRTNIEKIGGTVDIESLLGRGTTIKIKIPLTLAIIPALIVNSAGDCYAIPQISLLELVRLEGEQVHKSIENIHGAPVYRLRGNLLPLVYLNAQLQVESRRRDLSALDEVNIVVLQADDRPFGLVVDEIRDTEEIVVKPLQKLLDDVGAFSGATIMGDGKVALILDVIGLAQRANVVSSLRERTMSLESFSVSESAGDRQTVIVFAAPDDRRLAIPLTQVSRLEELPRSALERVGKQLVVQYRNEILPLIDVAEILKIPHDGRNGVLPTRAGKPRPEDAEDIVQLVVHASEGRLVGLMVGRILDIVEETIVSRSRSVKPCILLTSVIQGRVTEVLDIDEIIRVADPEFYEQSDGFGET